MTATKIRALLASTALIVTSPALASSLTYTPVNPTFGGSPLNGSFLMQGAAQNNFRYLTNPAQQNAQNTGPTTAQQFQSVITSALLGQIAQQISQDIVGPNAKQSGFFSVGGETIQFQQSNGQVNVTLTDPTTGGTTNISVPVPQY